MKTLKNILKIAVPVFGLTFNSYGQDKSKSKQKEIKQYYQMNLENEEPIKINAIDNNQDSVIDEYNLFFEDTGKILEIRCKDKDFDGKFEDSEKAIYYKKEHRINISVDFKMNPSVLEGYTEGEWYINCDKNHFKKNLFCYLNGRKTKNVEELKKSQIFSMYIDFDKLCDED